MSECEICGGVGFEIVVHDDREFAKTCACRAEGSKGPDIFERLRIPARYRSCTLGNFESASSPDMRKAHEQSMSFAAGYPHTGVSAGLGLLFTGSNGIGKTHLAVAVLRDLAETQEGPRSVLGLPRVDARNPLVLQPGRADDGNRGSRSHHQHRRPRPRRSGGLEDDGLDERHPLLHSQSALRAPASVDHHHQLRGQGRVRDPAPGSGGRRRHGSRIPGRKDRQSAALASHGDVRRDPDEGHGSPGHPPALQREGRA